MDKRLSGFAIALVVALCTASTALAEKTLVYLEHSETLRFDEERWPGCQILIGNVRFRHDSAYMYCDTAYFFNKSNTINATGNIRMEQGDSLFVYGDKLFYDGDKRLARLRNNVRMVDKSATLYTDSLNYDRQKNIGYYFVWGKIVDDTNVLTSINGTYCPDTEQAVFQRDVVLDNPDFVLNSDTLHYNTKSKIAHIVGPSTILHDSTTIYSEYGWYNTERDNSELLKNSVITDSEGRTLTADTIYYDHKSGFAESKRNVVLRDTTQSVMLKGGYGIFNEKRNDGYMIKRATFVEYSKADSMFLTADTIFFASSDDKTNVWGHYNVQSYHPDFQTLCDSMFYTSQDSIMKMFGTPVCWNGKNQITGDSIFIYSANRSIDMVDVLGNAFVFMELDSTAYNQISGKKIRGYISGNRLRKMNVDGNAMSVYYVEEDNKDSTATAPAERDYIGINKAESSELVIFVGADNRPERITMLPASNGTMYTPDKQSNKDIVLLKGFLNCAIIRPLDKYDIYIPKDRNILRALEANNKPRFKRKER